VLKEPILVHIVEVVQRTEVLPFLAGFELIDYEDLLLVFLVESPDEGAPDKTRSTCYNNHLNSPFLLKLKRVRIS